MDKILGIFDSALLKDIFYFLRLHPTWEFIAVETVKYLLILLNFGKNVGQQLLKMHW